MSENKKNYRVEIAKSDKRAKVAVDSFKVRKSGNSSIVTVPNIVKETLEIIDGEEIQYLTIKDENEEAMVVMKKAAKEKERENSRDERVESLLNETLDELDDILKALVEL